MGASCFTPCCNDNTAAQTSSDEKDIDTGFVELQSTSSAFPLHEAVNLGNQEVAVQLLSKKADVMQRDSDGDTPLHRAAYHGRGPLVCALLGAKADPNSLDRKSKTPLRRAYDNKDVAQALLAAGANPNAADKNG